MGRSKNSGLSFGTYGQTSIDNYELDGKLKEQAKSVIVSSVQTINNLVSEDDFKLLDDAKVKYNKDDVLFVTRDTSGQLVWLENGNESSGLVHIDKRHAKDYADKHGISKDKIPSHIKLFIQYGKLEYSKIVKRNDRDGYERLYSKSGEYYLLTGVGINGYLVSAYPISEKKATALIRRNKK